MTSKTVQRYKYEIYYLAFSFSKMLTFHAFKSFGGEEVLWSTNIMRYLCSFRALFALHELQLDIDFIYPSFQALLNCGDPGSPLNRLKLGSQYWTGKSVSFICHPGYRLIGPAARLCLPSGNWSGMQPSCKRLNSILYFLFTSG